MKNLKVAPALKRAWELWSSARVKPTLTGCWSVLQAQDTAKDTGAGPLVELTVCWVPAQSFAGRSF